MKTSKFDPTIEAWITDPDAALNQLSGDPEGFEASIHSSIHGSLKTLVPLFNRGVLAIAIFELDGHLLFATDAFRAMGITTLLEVRDRMVPLRPGSELGRLPLPGHAGQVFALEAASSETEHWQLPSAARTAQASRRESITLICVGSTLAATPLRWACQAHDMTDLEQRIVTAAIGHGNVKAAAQKLGISYVTARKAINQVCRDINVANLPALVSRIVATAFGALPTDSESPEWLADILPLTERQARFATLVAEGLSRQEISISSRCSVAVVRKELEAIFLALEINTATELARLIIECRAVSLIMAATDSSPGLFDPLFEPTRIHSRLNGDGRIAWSDYGPRSGRPILLVHSVWSCRSAPRGLVAALQSSGFRPISIDRPGFGLTDGVSNLGSGPFERAIEDVVEILHREKIHSLALVSRGAGQFVLELQRRLGGRIEKAVLVSPSPATTSEGRTKGPLGIAKKVFFERPSLMEPVVRLVSSQLTLERMQRLLLASAKDCPADLALANSPGWLRDHYRAIRPFSTGKWSGLLREQAVVSTNRKIAPLPGNYDWTIIIGERDHLNSCEEVGDFWSPLVPEAKFVVIPEGGRFMTASHVADILQQVIVSP